MDRLSRAHARRRSGPWRHVRPRHAVALVIAVWAVVALVPLASSLPPALATGAVLRRLHGELSGLGTGWYYVESSGTGSSTFVWEWSDGPVSTMTVQPGWREVSLELEPVSCPGGGLQHIVFHTPGSSATHLLRLTLQGAFKWYRVPLGWAHGSRELILRYRCVVVPALLHDGDPDQRALGVAIAGLVPTT